MKILILDGFPADKSTQLQPMLDKALAGMEFEHIRLSETDIAWCKGCFQCWLITPGECIHKDSGNDVASKFIKSDLAILLSPVTFGSYSSELKKAMDRFVGNLSGLFTKYKGETHHVKRYSKYPAMAVLGVQPTEDAEGATIFRELAYRNSLNFYPESFISHVFMEDANPDTTRSELASILKQVGVGI